MLAVLAWLFPALAQAQQENRLRRIAVKPHQGFTRVNLFFQSPPDYTLKTAPGKVRLEIRGADSPSFAKFRGYSDSHISGVRVSSRAGTVVVTVPVGDESPGVQAVSHGNPSVLSLDVGPSLKRTLRADITPGREPILSGIEQFVREYDPEPAGVPFVPTDAKLLKEMLPEGEAALFQYGESLLYRDQAEEAATVFNTFLDKPTAPRALAHFRLGEAYCLQKRYREALDSFKKGEELWPSYLDQAPELLQDYAEVMAKTGDYRGGRALLARLMSRFVGTPYQAEILNRMADMAARRGEGEAAVAMYRSAVVNAPGSAAAGRARLKLADRELFTVSRDRYRELLGKYRAIYQEPGDFALRDEALFKMSLLLALYAPSQEALETAISYDKRYPRGIYSTIVKKMREELLVPVYRELAQAGKEEALANLVLDNREYLGRCFSEPGFAERISQAFEKSALLTREIELFGYLKEKNWAAPGAPFMLSRVVDDALTLGNQALAESTAREFLSRYPADPHAGRVRERLGRLAFERGDLPGAGAELRFLAARGAEPAFAESDYYLGKALEAAGDHRGAVRCLSRFTTKGKGSPFIPDAYFTLSGSLAALKDHSRALAACQVGASVAAGETAAQFHYRAGELQLKLGEVGNATASWEKARAMGGTWGKLAGEALADLAWRVKLGKELL